MDRRAFLRSFGTGAGVVAAATVADVGLWADMMEWLRGPQRAYSIPARVAVSGSLTYTDINAISVKYISEHIADNWFKPSPLFEAIRADGEGRILVPFRYEGEIEIPNPRSSYRLKL